MPIAVPMPDKRAAAEGRAQHEGQGPQRERAGHREKRGRERGAPAPGDAAPREPDQGPLGAQHAGPQAADAALAGAQGAEQRAAATPGVNRRGARSGRTQPGLRGERPAGQGVQSKEASVAEAADAPPRCASLRRITCNPAKFPYVWSSSVHLHEHATLLCFPCAHGGITCVVLPPYSESFSETGLGCCAGLAAEQQREAAPQAPRGVQQGPVAKPGRAEWPSPGGARAR